MISLLYLTHSYSISLQSVNSLAYHPKWSTLKLNQHFTSRLYVTAMYQIGILNAIGYGREGFYTIRVRYMKGLIYLLDSVSGKDYICCTLFRVSHYYLYYVFAIWYICGEGCVEHSKATLGKVTSVTCAVHGCGGPINLPNHVLSLVYPLRQGA